jgi:hypothetical protein
MDQRSIVLYLNRKGWRAQVIHDDLVATLGEKAIAYSNIPKYLREAQTGRDGAMPECEEISPHINDADEAILNALQELSFSSVRQLSCATHLPETTVCRRFSEKLGFTARHLRWVLHTLTEAQNATRLQCSQYLLTILREQQTRAWHDIVTLDESWFYYITDHELIWLPPDGKVPDLERARVQSKT